MTHGKKHNFIDHLQSNQGWAKEGNRIMDNMDVFRIVDVDHGYSNLWVAILERNSSFQEWLVL